MSILEKHIVDALNLFRGKVDNSYYRNLALCLWFFVEVKSERHDEYAPHSDIEEISNKLDDLYRHSTPSQFSNFLILELNKTLKEVPIKPEALSALDVDKLIYDYPYITYQLFKSFSNLYFKNEGHYRKGFNIILGYFDKAGGKSGITSTPLSIRSLFRKIIGNASTLIDGACGFGGILSEFEYFQVERLFGQEINYQTIAIAALRFAFNRDITLFAGDSLQSEQLDIKADAVAINPPFNASHNVDEYHNPELFRYGQPSRNNANFLWINWAINHLQEYGRAVVLLSNNSLFSGAESIIRQRLISDGWVEAIITLPSRMFETTSIPSTIWVLSQAPRNHRDNILMVDLSNMGVTEAKNKVVLSEETIDRVGACFRSWIDRGIVDAFDATTAVSASLSEIERNGFNLSPARYLKVEGLEKYELDKAVELRSLIKIAPRAHSTSIVKKVSIKDLASSVDQYEIDVEKLEVASDPIRGTVHKGDVLLLAKNGDNLKPSYLPESTDDVSFALLNTIAFLVNTESVDVAYLIQELNKRYVKLQLDKYRHGSSVPYLRSEDLLSIKIVLPSLPEQKVSVAKEKEIRFQSMAKLHGFEEEIARLKEEQRKDLGSKKHNILQHLNNVKSSTDVLLKIMSRKGGVLKEDEVIDPRKGTTVGTRFQRLNESIERVLYYVDNLTNEISFGKAETVNILDLLQVCKEKGIQSDLFEVVDNSDIESFENEQPIIEISKRDFEELYNNLFENAIKHGFTEKVTGYVFRYSVSIEQSKVHIKFENNGKAFPKGMGTTEMYCTRGEKAGETANTGEGSWKVCQIVQHFGGSVQVIDEPESDYPVAINVSFDLAEINQEEPSI